MTNRTTLLHDQPRVNAGCGERVAAPEKNPAWLAVLEVLQTHKASTALFGFILVHIAYGRCLPLYNLVAFKKLDESTVSFTCFFSSVVFFISVPFPPE